MGRNQIPLALVFVPGTLAAMTAVLLFMMAFRPAIETHEGYLSIGKRIIPWMDIRRLDRTGWISPLIVRDHAFRRFPSGAGLPRGSGCLQQPAPSPAPLSRDALIDGIPYRQYWGEVLATGGERKQPPPPRYRILRPEDEAEVERLYQRLKTVGNLDQKNSTDEK